MVIGDPNSPRNLLNFCFSPILDLVNWAQFYNSKQESIYDDTILTVHTGMFHSDVSELKLTKFFDVGDRISILSSSFEFKYSTPV